MLPDDILIVIFDFYVDEEIKKKEIQEWMTLVHVCRRWRIIVFQSPRRLNLQLVCTPLTPPRDTLDIWPPLPLIIHDITDIYGDVDNTIAALEHNDRVCQIRLSSPSTQRISRVTRSAAMQKSFPELMELYMASNWDFGPTLSDSFLGGTAPRLQSLELSNISFPALPKLLLSATHLVKLDLSYIPCSGSGYIPPEAMATSLSTLTDLEYLRIHFRYRPPAPENLRPPLLTRSILPILTTMQFEGASGYLEEILARIDAPRLDKMLITFHDPSIFDTSQLFQFISQISTLRSQEMGHIIFKSGSIIVKFLSQISALGELCVEMTQLSSLAQVCTSSLPPVSTLEDLYILEDAWPEDIPYDVENMQWLQLLHPFANVKNLYLCNEFVPCIAHALEELVGTRTTEVLLALENIFLEVLQPSGPILEGIETFVAARRLTNHPVAVSRWNKD